MKVLVCGASGFIGSAITRGLRAAGHEVVRGVRTPLEPGDIAIDFSRDTVAAAWLPRLQGIDAVVNAIGIIVEQRGVRFADVHARAPIALFEACARAGVSRVIQISALGAQTGDTEYFRTKRLADESLMASALAWQVLRPSLVYGEDGASAASFRMLATLPVIALPALPATALFRPIHIDDLVAAVVRAIDTATPARQCIDCVGASAHSLRQMIDGYRKAFALGGAWWISIPRPLMRVVAFIAGKVPGMPLNPETWRMLQQGSDGDPAALTRFLGRPPIGLAQFMTDDDAERLATRALSTWQQPLLRATLALIWITTALLSVFVHPRAESLAMLARVGLTGAAATVALYGASALDLVLGLAALFRPGRPTWVAQIIVVLGYSALIALTLPEWLLHPFGPVLKNLAILAILVLLLSGDRRWTTRR